MIRKMFEEKNRKGIESKKLIVELNECNIKTAFEEDVSSENKLTNFD